MAQQKGSGVSLGKSLEALLLSGSYHSGEHIYSSDDQKRIGNALTLWLLTIMDYSKEDGLSRVYSYANIQRCACWLANCDVPEVLGTLNTILQQLRLWSPYQGDQRFKAYKAHFLQPGLEPNTFSLMWPYLTHFYRQGFSPIVFRRINTILQYWKRLTLHDVTWVEEQSLQAYFDLEANMSEWEYPEDIVSELHQLVLRNFGVTVPKGVARPRNSSGATADVKRGKGQTEKFKYIHSSWWTQYLGVLLGICAEHPCEHIGMKLEPSSHSVQAFVPKGIDDKRGISMDQTSKMFWQHAVADCFDYWFCRHPSFGVDLHDQEHNRSYCLRGSRRLTHATIDLSSASDTVTWKLVKAIFADTEWLTLLYLSRSETCKVDGRVVTQAKFAPMGSAACFPVECVVFASVAQLACKRVGCKPDYRVYGDDIVIPSAAFEECCRLLTALHFKVNETKSFGSYSDFLEACGMEAYCGTDVTPYRLSRWYDIVAIRSDKSPANLPGSIKLVNDMWDNNCFMSRKYVISDILAHYGPVPFSVDPERGIYHPDPGNVHLRTRWEPDLQKVLHKVVTCEADSRKGSDDIRYQLMLERYELSKREKLDDPKDLIVIRAGTTCVKLKYTWRDLSAVRYADPWQRNLP